MILAESGQSVTHLRGKKQCQAKLPAAASGFSLKPTGQTSVLSPFWEFSHRISTFYLDFTGEETEARSEGKLLGSK